MQIRWGYVVVIAVLSFLALVLSGLTSDGSFTSPLLLQLGGGGLLFAGLFWIQKTLIERRLDEVERKTGDLAVDVQHVEEEVKKANVRLDAVGVETQKALQTHREADREALQAFEQDVSSQTVRDLLDRANRLNALAPGGIRVRLVPSSWHRLRFGGDLLGVKVTLESYDGDRIKSWVWSKSQSVQTFMSLVAEELMRRNIYPGGSLDSGELFRAFKSAIDLAMRCRWGEVGPMDGIERLVELPNPEWAVTTFGLEALRHTYPIPASRFLESDWRAHIREKIAFDFDQWEEAFSLAEALLKGPHSPFDI